MSTVCQKGDICRQQHKVLIASIEPDTSTRLGWTRRQVHDNDMNIDIEQTPVSAGPGRPGASSVSAFQPVCRRQGKWNFQWDIVPGFNVRPGIRCTGARLPVNQSTSGCSLMVVEPLGWLICVWKLRLTSWLQASSKCSFIGPPP